MSVAISVIVPVYNMERTLGRCVQSILKQTFQNFEVLLIDDGSTDQSGLLCDQYAKHSNVRVIHKENEGAASARNRGILEATGDYIYHCDADDWLLEDLLQKAYAAIRADASDVVIFGYDIFTETNGNILPYDSVRIPAATYACKEEARHLLVQQYDHSYIVLSACNRLYRRLFLIENALFFPALRRCQDIAYSFLLFDRLEKLTILEEAYYCYTIDPGTYKGRSYPETLGIYLSLFDSARETFGRWGLNRADAERRLINHTCKQIANDSAYSFAVQYRADWREHAATLLRDERARRLFGRYENSCGSRFMMLFTFAIRVKSKRLLLIASKIQQTLIRMRK